jgi:16S rRNA U516 pseudouridylate synthase RsuA-like enzyme
MTIRLNKHIAETGFCSRREADRLIAERRVTVNNMPAGMGAVVGEGDEVKVDGQPLRVRNKRAGGRKHVYIVLNKPVGITCTTESAVSGNIIDFIGHQERIFPIGRLDKDSEGLILLTSTAISSTRSCAPRTGTRRSIWLRSTARSPMSSCAAWRAACLSTVKPPCPAAPARSPSSVSVSC